MTCNLIISIISTDAPTQSPAWPSLAPHLTQGMMERSCPSPLVWDYAEVASTADQEVTFEPGRNVSLPLS